LRWRDSDGAERGGLPVAAQAAQRVYLFVLTAFARRLERFIVSRNREPLSVFFAQFQTENRYALFLELL